MNRRDLFTWWRKKPESATREVAPALARIVEPTLVEDPEPFSLATFYAARKETK